METSGIIRRQFASWESVERLHVAGIDLVIETVNELMPQPGLEPLYPNLTELILADFPTWMLANNFNDLRKTLFTVLRSRRKLRKPIKTIRLTNLDAFKKTPAFWDELTSLVCVCGATRPDLSKPRRSLRELQTLIICR